MSICKQCGKYFVMCFADYMWEYNFCEYSCFIEYMKKLKNGPEIEFLNCLNEVQLEKLYKLWNDIDNEHFTALIEIRMGEIFNKREEFREMQEEGL